MVIDTVALRRERELAVILAERTAQLLSAIEEIQALRAQVESTRTESE